ncbi:ImmA/IrrE family metallo-endopeptidase [Microbacterium sp. R1]|uniref:Metallo-endopeptidase n=1 Tax=Microbacterium phage vB_MoxS-R1 TaxID=2848881 RepID=A0A8F2E4I3_9CAUD|nr:ImmA/IrrE family metallo-endopeptidase [Microbacterium sp. R1]YP_010649882.1 metallo-protease [Microbacterium phage vB_MoxS-R1]MBE7953579.1 ImmA/IrrE family metallo-endopeptidase [Microbacterium sp. R1]QWT28852.1 metallo-endopeptidase [Microbacterium phage vB_MoxS-R1]
MKVEQLYEMADMLGVAVEHTDLSHLGRDGDYDLKTNTIRLQEGMASRLLRCVFAHELCHAVFGDVTSKFGPVNAKQERRADEWAALRLIDHDDYRLAEDHHDGNVQLMAQTLDVVDDILTAYQRVLLRIGETVYVGPRMGEGQWAAKVSA